MVREGGVVREGERGEGGREGGIESGSEGGMGERGREGGRHIRTRRRRLQIDYQEHVKRSQSYGLFLPARWRRTSRF